MNARTPPARGAASQLEPLRPLRDLASLLGDVSVHARGEPTHRYAIRRRPIVHLSNLGIADLDERREGRNLTWQDRKAHVDRARVAPVVGGSLRLWRRREVRRHRGGDLQELSPCRRAQLVDVDNPRRRDVPVVGQHEYPVAANTPSKRLH